MQNFMVNILSSLRGKLNLQFIVGFSCWIYQRSNCRSGYVAESGPRSTLNQQWIWKCLIKHWRQTSVDPMHFKTKYECWATHSFLHFLQGWLKNSGTSSENLPNYLPLGKGKEKKSVKLLSRLQFLFRTCDSTLDKVQKPASRWRFSMWVGSTNWHRVGAGGPEHGCSRGTAAGLGDNPKAWIAIVVLSIKIAIENPMRWIHFQIFPRVKHRNQTYSFWTWDPQAFGQDMPLMDDASDGPVFASPWRLAGTLEMGDLCAAELLESHVFQETHK